MASSNIKDIKRRIKSVESTMQITKAMELVASSKLRKAKERADNSSEYFKDVYQTVCKTAQESPQSIYTKQPTGAKKVLYIVIAGDRGLAGGFNGNVLKTAQQDIDRIVADNGEVLILPIGKKTVEYFERREYTVVAKYTGIAEHLKIYDAQHISDVVMELFNSGKINSVELIYTKYVSPLLQEPHQMTLLPIPVTKPDKPLGYHMLTEFDPSPEEVFKMLVPRYIADTVYCTIVESFASEQACRRNAMENATNNATEMIDSLSLMYNRARQSAITQEITEIVSGASSVD